MAFVITPYPALRTTAFTGHAVDQRPVTHTARVQMAVKDNPDSLWTSVGKSKFKENIFTGGMPGGEAFYKAWVADGMKKDFPDLPSKYQPKGTYRPKKQVKTGTIPMLDKIEFFKGFTMPSGADDDGYADAPEKPESNDSAAPSPALYEQYFPADRINRAPDISIVYENDYLKDNVSMGMTEVNASASDVYYPKEMKNKAPVIDISYNGALSYASVTVSMKLIEGPPTLAPPPKAEGDTIASLVPGSGGGLKLQFEALGEGTVDI
ncbi:unnamed protein product [Agarophyton chilense]